MANALETYLMLALDRHGSMDFSELMHAFSENHFPC